jgi:4-carboxymuconolactone decarboxylase
MDLARLLARPGLDPGTRRLILAELAIAPADWPTFEAVIEDARRAGQRRSDFEEMLLQAVLFFGFPRLVTAFERLQAAWPAPPPQAGGGVPPAERTPAGRALFATVYGRNDEAVRARLAALHGELHDFVLEAAYGRILARPGLDLRTRELLAVAALAAQDQIPQLVAHGRAALALGAAPAALHEAVFCSLGDEQAAADCVRRVGRA